MKSTDLMAIGVALLVLQMIALWEIDISTSAMINNAVVTNGFFMVSPMVTYHMGLYIIITTAFLQVLILIHIVGGGDAKKVTERH